MVPFKIYLSFTQKRQHCAHDETKPHKACLFLGLLSTEGDWWTRNRKFRTSILGRTRWRRTQWGRIGELCETGIIHLRTRWPQWVQCSPEAIFPPNLWKSTCGCGKILCCFIKSISKTQTELSDLNWLKLCFQISMIDLFSFYQEP